MKHLLFIDPLEKLVPKKDSTLLLAHTLKEKGQEVYLLFEKDFYILSSGAPRFEVYDFDSALDENLYISKFELANTCKVSVDDNTIFHMRLDPPFDTRYLKYLWMIKDLKRYGMKALNDPEGIMLHNEKIHPLEYNDHVQSYIGSSTGGFKDFCASLKNSGYESIIVKPVDLYQGIGVEKFSLSDSDLILKFEKKSKDFHGPLMAQPYLKAVESGEIRTVYFNGLHLGTIKKTPPKGEFLANIAQGASFEMIKIPDHLNKICLEYSKNLAKDGVYWLAFDILDNKVNEVNTTCPGLLVEVSVALKENLALLITDELTRLFG